MCMHVCVCRNQAMWEKACPVLTVSAVSCNWRCVSSSVPGGGRSPSLHSSVFASPLSPALVAHDTTAAETHLGPHSFGRGEEGEREEGERMRERFNVLRGRSIPTFPSADVPTVLPACQM